MASGIRNRDITVTIEDDSAVAQTIGKINSFQRSGMSGNLFDNSTFDDTRQTFCQGLPNSGQIVLGVLSDYDDAGQAAMRDAFQHATNNEREMVVTLPSGTTTTFTFNVLVDSWDDDGSDINGELQQSWTLQISGGVTEA